MIHFCNFLLFLLSDQVFVLGVRLSWKVSDGLGKVVVVVVVMMMLGAVGGMVFVVLVVKVRY